MARIRSSGREKEAAAASAVRDVDLKHLWRQLRAVGWKARKPAGLATVWTYVKPGATGAEEGVDVFLGEQALVEHALASGIIEETEGDGSDVGEVEEAKSDEPDEIRVSQIDTSVSLSQNTVDRLFASESAPIVEEGVDLSQSAVARAFDLSQTVLDDASSSPNVTEVVLTLQRLSEASDYGGDSDADEQQPRQPPSSSTRVYRDVNYLNEKEDESDYESLSSGESDGVGFDDDCDDDVQRAQEEEELVEDEHAPGLDEAFLREIGGFKEDDQLSKKELDRRKAALRAMVWEPVSPAFEANVDAFPGLVEEEAKPVLELRRVAHDPLETLFFFMPKSLWVEIAEETNRYNSQQVVTRAQQIRTRQQQAERRTPDALKVIRRRLRAKAAYGTHEILHVLGLLVAHMLSPDTRRFSNHWSMTDDGAMAAGVFGRFMARNRCTDIIRDLHFVDNEAPRSRDKLWKLRMVSDRLQERFLIAWTLPGVFSFDEGVMPATSRRNTTRMFMPDKPHRYGSKLFMTCDSRTAYCHRFEFYVGKRDRGDVSGSFDNNSGAAAVIRNLKVLLGADDQPPEHPAHPERLAKHAVVIDRFYSSVPLAVELLKMNVYVVGTCMTNRLGFPRTIVESRSTRPASIPRGSFLFSRSTQVPGLVALHWWDRKPVHYLCTGAVMTQSIIRRNIKGVGPIQVPCPRIVNDYQQWMGGVDVHDQRRLQKYSIQTSVRFRKYYKSLFFGLVDFALVNAYISHKETAKIDGTRSMTRGEWYGVLHHQLLKLKAEDFAGVSAPPLPSGKLARQRNKAAAHTLVQMDDWVTVSGVQKRRQRSCKVCALLRGERKKSFQTTFYCEKCSVDRAKCYLCPKARREYKGVAKTCFQIWHEDFDCGKLIPRTLGKRVVLRRPGGDAGPHKKTRRELVLDGDGDGDGDEEGDVARGNDDSDFE